MANKRKGFTKHRYFSKEQMHEYVQQAIDGNQQAFTKLFERFKPIMYNNIKKRFPGEQVEFYEDEILMFFGRMFTKDISKFDPTKAQFDSWLTHCFTMHMNGIRRRKKQVYTKPIDEVYKPKDDDYQEFPIPDTGTTTQNLLESTLSFRRIARLLLTHLTKKEARILLDKFWYGYDDREIEARHNLAYKTAWYNWSRAAVKAREILKNYV